MNTNMDIDEMEEIRNGLWNLIGGDKWGSYEETSKFAESQPKIKNGQHRMLCNRMTRTGLGRYVRIEPQGAKKFLEKLKKKPISYFLEANR
jgi:hypothetical protein